MISQLMIIIIIIVYQNHDNGHHNNDVSTITLSMVIGHCHIISKVRSQKKKRYYLGIFPNMGVGDLPKSQNFCKFTMYFFVCQIHSEVLKHVLQMGG